MADEAGRENHSQSDLDSGTTEQDMVDSEEQSMLKKRSFQW